MNEISTQVSIDVYPDPEYSYKILGPGDQIQIQYYEDNKLRSEMSFGSREEMLAVARAMIKVCEMSQ